MTAREYAKLRGFEVIGKLKRMPDIYYGMDDKHHYPWWIDEAGNEYLGSYTGEGVTCIVTKDGGVI